MIKIFFSQLIELPDVETIQKKLIELPVLLQQKTLGLKNKEKQALALTGKLLLQKSIDFFSLEIGLKEIEYEISGKPFFKSPLQFNITYSKNVVACAATLQGKIGIDAEEVHALDISLYQSYFSPLEWDTINNNKEPLVKFFEYWTRKEALLKASGIGIVDDMRSVDVIEDNINFENSLYYLQKINLLQSSVCHIACTIPQQIEVQKLELFDSHL